MNQDNSQNQNNGDKQVNIGSSLDLEARIKGAIKEGGPQKESKPKDQEGPELKTVQNESNARSKKALKTASKKQKKPKKRSFLGIFGKKKDLKFAREEKQKQSKKDSKSKMVITESIINKAQTPESPDAIKEKSQGASLNNLDQRLQSKQEAIGKDVSDDNLKSKKAKKDAKRQKGGLFGLFKNKKKQQSKPQKPEKGNAFTAVFNQKIGEDEFIDAIANNKKQAEAQKKKLEQKTPQEQDGKDDFKTITKKFDKKNPDPLKRAEKFAKRSRVLVTASLLVPVMSFAYFYSTLTPGNIAASTVNVHNFGEEREIKENLLEQSQKEKRNLVREENILETKITELNDNQILKEITDQKINWLELMVKIENVANKLFHNDVTNIVTFTNYSGDSEKSKINVQGFVKDPSGKSFTRLTSLITALNEHPNFSGASVRSFSKSEDADGYFKSTFNLEFVYTPDQIETEEPEMAEDATTAELEGSINESSSTLNDEQELTEFDSDGLDVETIESVETSGDSSKEEASPSSNASDVVGEAAPQANQVNGETPKTTAQESQEVPVSEGDAAAQVPAENSADAQIEEFELESKANTLPLRNN